ncbi:MAG: tRNA splicing endonuclease [Crocinitomicaceae bacterium]|jgi:tRNA splicing endonuclease
MEYTLQEIFKLAGNDDKVAVLSIASQSPEFHKFGKDLTVQFIYTQKERESRMKLLKNQEDDNVNGTVMVKYLNATLTKEQIKELESTGISSTSITSILPSPWLPDNHYTSEEKRTIRTIPINTKMQENGGDINWMYGFKKRMVEEGTGLCPAEYDQYLAWKLMIEPEDITKFELKSIHNSDGSIRESIEETILMTKGIMKTINKDEIIRFKELRDLEFNKRYEALKQQLLYACTSLKRMATTNMEKLLDLNYKVTKFRERRLNTIGKVPIYIDLDSYLHICFRHVEEFQITKQYERKDNYQWIHDDLITVLQHVVSIINKEAQAHWIENPGKDYCRLGKNLVYFEGDYYAINIKGNGRVSTIYKCTLK